MTPAGAGRAGAGAGLRARAGAGAGAGRRAPVVWLAVTLGLLGTALAAWGSWIPSLWGDEVTTSMSSRRSWASLAAMSGHVDAVHSTYYALMHLWVGAFGIGEVALRFPSALGVGATVAGVFVLVLIAGTPAASRVASPAASPNASAAATARAEPARAEPARAEPARAEPARAAPVPAAVLAALVTAILPRMTYAGEEARSFALTAAVATWILVVAVATLRGRIGRRTGWWIVAALTVIGTYLFLYVLLMVPVVAALVVLDRRARPGALRARRGAAAAPDHRRTWAWSTLVALAAIVPVLAAGWFERAQVAYLTTSVTTDPFSLVVGIWFQTPVAAVAGWTCIVVALGVAVVGRLRAVPWVERSPSRSDVVFGTVVVLWAFLPTVLLVAAQPVFHGFSGRYMTFTAPAVAMLVARGVGDIARGIRDSARRVGDIARGSGDIARGTRAGVRPAVASATAAALVIALAALLAPTYLAQRTPYAKNGSDWSEVATVIGSHANPGDDVLFDETAKPSRRPRLALRAYPGAFRGLDDVALTVPWWRNTTWHDGALPIDAAVADGRVTSRRVWVVQELADPSGGTEGDAALRSAGYRPTRTWRLHTDEVTEWRTTP